MSVRTILIILFGAVPATWWSIYLVHTSAFILIWIIVCWVGAIALWVAALATHRVRASAVYRGAIIGALSLGILLAAIPAGLNLRLWLLHFGAMSLKEHLWMLCLLGSFIGPIAASSYCLRSMFTANIE